jgi:hypothetical protein
VPVWSLCFLSAAFIEVPQPQILRSASAKGKRHEKEHEGSPALRIHFGAQADLQGVQSERVHCHTPGKYHSAVAFICERVYQLALSPGFSGTVDQANMMKRLLSESTRSIGLLAYFVHLAICRVDALLGN